MKKGLGTIPQTYSNNQFVKQDDSLRVLSSDTMIQHQRPKSEFHIEMEYHHFNGKTLENNL